jgi:TPR repeat protein
VRALPGTAQYKLGISYTQGQGVRQDYAEAARWYRKAAEQGYAKAQFNLGFMYHEGLGVARDYVEAIRWVRRAADQGDVRAQDSLGIGYAFGQGVPRDYAEAACWYRKAAEQGDRKARGALLSLYCQGRGMPLAAWVSNIVVILLAPLMLFTPKSTWAHVRWLPWAICSAICAAMLVHELVLSALSILLVPEGSPWTSVGHAFLITVFGGGSVICAITSIRAGGHISKQISNPE